MLRIEPVGIDSSVDAARLITALRTELNGRAVCTETEMKTVIERALSIQTYHGYVARLDNTVCGYIGINDRFAIYANGHFCQITELFIDPKFRRRGVGRLMLSFIEKEAVNNGMSSIEVNTPFQNHGPATYNFYDSCGYKHAGSRHVRQLL